VGEAAEGRWGELSDGDPGCGRLPITPPSVGFADTSPTGGGPWMHGFAASRGSPLKVWKGTRSAGHRPEVFDKYRFDEADRSARSLSASIRWAALLRLSRTRSRSLSGETGRRGRGPMGNTRALSPSTPTAGGLPNDGRPRTARVTPSRLPPLDRPPPPQWSLALRPFRCGEVGSGYDCLEGWGSNRVEKVQGVEIPRLCSLSAEHKPPGTRTHGKAPAHRSPDVVCVRVPNVTHGAMGLRRRTQRVRW
jgi:hypothetical protein